MADVPRQPDIRVSTGDGLQLTVTHHRPTKTEPTGSLVVVHGWGEHRGRYQELADSLVGLGLSVWCYDLRGHGSSGGPRGHAPRFSTLVEDLSLVTEHARGMDGRALPWFLLGHSLGGLIALRSLQTGSTRPAAACLSAPWLRTARAIPHWKRGMARVLYWVAPSLPIANPLDPTALTRDAGKIEEHDADPLVHGMMTPRLFFEVERAQNEAFAAAGSVDCPVLVLIPGDDPVVDGAATAHFVHRAGRGGITTIEIPRSRHEPFNEVDRKDRFDEVGSFFNGVLGMNSDKDNAAGAQEGVAEEDINGQVSTSDGGQAETETEPTDALDGVIGSAAEGPLGDLLAERDQIRDQHLRLAADFDNYRKRMEADSRVRWDRAQAELVGRLMEPMDDLERVATWDPETTSVDAIVEGVDLVERKFLAVIKEVGVEMINPVGEQFDPNTMEAMMRVPAESPEQDEIVEKVFQKGCSLKGQLVRPARVSVYKAE